MYDGRRICVPQHEEAVTCNYSSGERKEQEERTRLSMTVMVMRGRTEDDVLEDAKDGF